jgi:hypothetical protein
VIHRIVGGDAESGFVTQGDNRNAPDQWHPRGSDILGEAWLHVPGAGSWLSHLRQPMVFAVLIGLIGFGVVVPARKRARKRGNVTMQKTQPPGPGPSLSPLWAVTGFAVMVTAVSAMLAVYAFTQDETSRGLVQRPRYTQSTAFDYTVLTQASTLYPEGKVGPVSQDAESGALPPIYSRLVHALDVGFEHRLEGAATDVTGTYDVELAVSAGENEWSRTQLLTSAQPFDGPSLSGRARVNLAPIRTMIDAIEKETGVSANFYTIAVRVLVQSAGTVEGEAFTASAEPAVSFRLSRSRLTPPETLLFSQGEDRAEPVSETRELGAAGVGVPVSRLRVASLAGTGIGLTFALAVAAAVYTGVGQGPATRVRMRYGVSVLPVSRVEEQGARTVQVESLDDLARLAQRGGGVIFEQQQGRSQRYFIADGATTVEYVSAPGGPRLKSAAALKTGVPNRPSAS